MTKPLPVCFLVCCFLSCNLTARKTGHLFVNQQLIENNIQAVQRADHIELSVETTNNRDSILIVSLSVDPKIPDDSLNAARATLILSSFIVILPNQSLQSFSACKVVFVKKEGSLTAKSRSIEFTCPMTTGLLARVDSYKDSARVALGYIDSSWTYINQDLNLTLPLKAGWFYESEEHDSLVYYAIGSDINQLPQYRTDTDRKVTFLSLRKLNPGGAYPVLQLNKNNALLMVTDKAKADYQGSSIFVGLILNHFDSEDKCMKNLYELFFSKKLPDYEIHSYSFGNAGFRGHQFAHNGHNGKKIYYLSVVKRFRKVSLVLNMKYSNDKELEEIKNELSGLKIN